ncbi:T9SS type A sorting domain-containing protein [Aequorivita marina]|uniref:T9SS type A sorting domain-containing protein n=1 Tax=Aequorivita marina TaxID=3073654 RepID=UPI002876454F|nr:T9SS type A sorting domain-containing protein [Aequorivita sp. S2608]MDS1297473.1 T9SS type A sorting domain-containing protein [Aequorivita sp. S2608]
MKKALLFISLFLIIQVSAAQPSAYFVDHWYLHSFTFNDEVITIADLDITEGPTMIIQNDYTLHGFGFCNNYTGQYEYINNEPLGVDDNFIPRNAVIETENCGDYEAMENYFFIPFVEEKIADIYEINLSGNDKQIVLQYDSSYGYQVYKNFPALAIHDNSIKDWVLFPNPVQNKLMIQSVIKNFDFVSIADINGRIIHSEKNMVSNIIDVSALKPGMYFITITSPEGNSMNKFIKN